MWLCLVPILLQLLTKKAPEPDTLSVAPKYWAHTDNTSPSAIAEVIDGLSLPLHKPIIANLDTAHLRSVFSFFSMLTLTMPTFLNDLAVESSRL